MKGKIPKDTTQYLMSSEVNHKRLLEAIERSNCGEAIYDPKFVAKIERGDEDILKGNTTKITLDEIK